MQIAMRELITSSWRPKPPSPLDYVQDGLLAMWDGEWNAEGGVHDEGYQGLWNIGGSWGNISLSNSSWSIGENYVESLINNNGIHLAYPSQSWYQTNLLDAEGYSMELVCSFSTQGVLVGTAQANQCSLYGFSGNRYTWSFVANNNFNGRGSSVSGSDIYWVINYTSLPSAISIGQSVRIGVSQLRHLNGSFTSKAGGGITGTQYYSANRNRFTIGVAAQTSTGSIPLGFRIYGARLYNRPLSQSEFLINHKLDQKRFGVP